MATTQTQNSDPRSETSLGYERTESDSEVLARLKQRVARGAEDWESFAVQLLDHPSEDVVKAAAQAMGKSSKKRSQTALRSLLSSHHGIPVAMAAARSLSQIGTESSFQVFEAILENSEDPLHRPLLDELATLKVHPRLVGALRQNLYAPDYPFKARTLEVLSRFRGPTAEELFREFLEEGDEPMAVASAQGLGAFPSPANYRRLADRLQLGPWTVQAACLEAMLKIESRPPAKDLTGLLSSSNPEILLRILKVLCRKGEAVAIPSVEALLTHPQWKVRVGVAQFMGSTQDPRALESLELLFQDTRAKVRAAAAEAASFIPSSDSFEWGRRARADQAAVVRAQAPKHLEECGSKEARNMLLGLLKDQSGEVRLKALEALQEFDLVGFEPFLVNLAQDSEPKVRTLAKALRVALGAPDDEFHLEEAERLVEAGELEKARELLRHLAMDRPEDTRVVYELAKVARSLKELPEAEIYLSKVLDENPRHLGAQRLLVETLLDQEKTDLGIEALRHLLGLDPENWRAATLFAELSLKAGRPREARGALERAVELNPQHRRARALLAQSLEALSQKESAFREWNLLHRKDPADPEPLFAMGRLKLALNEAEEALPLFDRCHELGRKDGELYRLRAQARTQTGDEVGALRDREKAMSLSPSDPEDRFELARAYLEAGESDRALAGLDALDAQSDPTPERLALRARAHEARGELERALDLRIQVVGLDESFPGALRDHGLLLRKMGRYDAAREVLRKHLDSHPEDRDVVGKLTELELLAGRSDAALTLIEQSLTWSPHDAELHAHKARILRNRTQWEESLKAARKAAELAPKTPQYRVLLGDLFSRTEAHEAARHAYEHALELGGEDPTLRLRLGRLYLEAKSPAKALIHLEKAKESELGQGVEFQLLLGQAYWKLTRVDRARSCFAQARQPGDARAHRFLAELELDHGDPREALDHLRQLERLAPEDELLPWLEGRARRLLNEPGVARDRLQKALEHFPGDPDLIGELGACFLALGNYRELLTLYPGSPLLPHKDAEIRIAKATAHFRLGNFAKAAALSKRMSELDPDLVEARVLRARSLRKLGELEAAREVVELGLEIDSDQPDLLAERAELNLAKGSLEAALVDARRGLAFPEEHAVFFWIEARAQLGLEEPQKALQSLAHYLLRAPRNLEAHQLKASILRDLDRPEEALEALETLSRTAPEKPSPYLERAEILLEMGKVEPASELLQAYLERSEEKAPALRHLARIEEGEGKLEAATQTLRQLVEVEDGEFARFKLIQVLLRKKDTAAAWPILERAQELYPDMAKRLASDSLDRGETGLARDLFAYQLSRSPRDLECQVELGVCQYRLGKYPEARRVFERALSQNKLQPQAHYYLGLLALLDRKEGLARKHFEVTVAEAPENRNARRHLAQIYLSEAKFQKALEVSRSSKGREDRELLLVEAASYQSLGQDRPALEAYQKAGRIQVDPRSHLPAIRLALKHGLSQPARDLAQEYRGSRPEDPAGARLLARAAAACGDPALSRDVLQELWREGNASAQDLRSLARAASATDQLDLAAKSTEHALELEPKHAETWVLLGHIQLARKVYLDAQRAYRRAGELAPRLAEADRGLAEALLPQSRFREALEPAQKAVEKKPEDPRNLHLLAQIQMGLKQWRKARESLEKALGFEAPKERAHQIRLDLAQVLRNQGEIGNAKRILESMPKTMGRDVARNVAEMAFESEDYAATIHHAKAFLSQYPEEPGILELLGRSLVQVGMDQQARACLKRMATLYSTPVGLVRDLAQSRLKKGQAPQAILLLVEALEQKPGAGDLWLVLAQARTLRGDKGGAESALEKAYEIDPTQKEVIQTLGTSYLGTRNFEKARVLFTEATRRFPYEMPFHLGLGRAYQGGGHGEHAVRSFQKACEISRRSSEPFRELGLALARMGRRNRSVEALQVAVRNDPKDVEALFALARAHRDRGEHDLATLQFERLLEVAGTSSKEARAARSYLRSQSQAA